MQCTKAGAQEKVNIIIKWRSKRQKGDTVENLAMVVVASNFNIFFGKSNKFLVSLEEAKQKSDFKWKI
jgi:hypothetical protein